jgi:hypothetical protein
MVGQVTPPPQLTRQLLPTYNSNYNRSRPRRPEPRSSEPRHPETSHPSRREPRRSRSRRTRYPSRRYPSHRYPSHRPHRYPSHPACNQPGQTGKHPRSSCPPLHHSFDELLLHEDGPRGLANDLAHRRRPPRTTCDLTEGTQMLGTLRQPDLTFRYSRGYVSDFTLSALTVGHRGSPTLATCIKRR